MRFVNLSSFECWGTAYADHLEKEGYAVKRFFLGKRPKVKFPSKKDIVKGEIMGVFKMLSHPSLFRNAKIYCTGGQFAAMLVSRLFGRSMGKEHHLYLHNFYLHSLGNNKWVRRVLRFLMDSRKLTLIAQTPGELAFYRKLSDKMELKFAPYCSDVKERQNTIPIRGGVYLYWRIYQPRLCHYDETGKA